MLQRVRRYGCECSGLCGEIHERPRRGRCGIRNGAWIIRGAGTGYAVVPPPVPLFPELLAPGAVQVFLQVAHLDHDPANVAPWNLRALCARCHTAYDASRHAQTTARRAREAREEAGQLALAVLAPSVQ